jgi:hypothetical protein
MNESTVFQELTSHPGDIQIPSVARNTRLEKLASNRSRSAKGVKPDRAPSSACPSYSGVQLYFLPPPPPTSKVPRFESMLISAVFIRNVDSHKSDPSHIV